MSASEASAAKRKHITSACVPCRESKVKCDGVMPVCSSCQNKGKPCQYQAGDDKRKLSHRMVIEILADRIDGLCHFIRQNSLEPPPIDEEKHTSLTKGLGHLRLSDTISSKDGFNTSRHTARSFSSLDMHPASAGHPSSGHEYGSGGDNAQALGLGTSAPSDDGFHKRLNPRSESDPEMPIDTAMLSMPDVPSPQNGTQGLDLSSFPGWGWPASYELPSLDMTSGGMLGVVDQVGQAQVTPSNGHRATDLRQSIDNATDISDNSTETLVRELSDRIGSLRIGPGGQVRYYGPTSNFNLVDMGAPDNLTVHRSVRDHGPDYLNRLDMGKEVPQWLEDHLINLYFAWQDPAFHVVKRGMYEKAKFMWRDQKEDTSYFSESLQNALCCLGAAFEARHHPTFTTFPKSLSDFFADRAKTLLEIELDQPSVATVQALVVLSSHDIGCKRDTRGWLYSGMATRLAFHLALHLDMTSYVASKSITKEEADLRRDVFWAGYTVDHIWSFHLGRAFRINMETVTVKHPEGDDVSQWVPYVTPKPMEPLKPLPDHTVACHRQRVLLCEITAPIGFALYGNLGMAPGALHELNIATVTRLLAWKANMPPCLQVDEDNCEGEYLPHVLLLHMLYHQNIIYTHRPWMSRRTWDSQPHLREGHDPEHARGMCIGAAVSIAKLLQIYELRYGLRRINIQAVGITCSAALLLIFAVVVAKHNPSSAGLAVSSDADPAQHLGPCFRALDEFAVAWESAKQARDFLTLLQRRWETQARTVVAAGRDSQSPPVSAAAESVPSKRPRTDDVSVDMRNHRPWMGQHDALAVDMNVDLDWIFMGGNGTPGNGWNANSLDSLL